MSVLILHPSGVLYTIVLSIISREETLSFPNTVRLLSYTLCTINLFALPFRISSDLRLSNLLSNLSVNLMILQLSRPEKCVYTIFDATYCTYDCTSLFTVVPSAD